MLSLLAPSVVLADWPLESLAERYRLAMLTRPAVTASLRLASWRLERCGLRGDGRTAVGILWMVWQKLLKGSICSGHVVGVKRLCVVWRKVPRVRLQRLLHSLLGHQRRVSEDKAGAPTGQEYRGKRRDPRVQCSDFGYMGKVRCEEKERQTTGLEMDMKPKAKLRLD